MKSKKNRKYTKKKYLTKKQKSKRGGNRKARQIALQNAQRKIDQQERQRAKQQAQGKIINKQKSQRPDLRRSILKRTSNPKTNKNVKFKSLTPKASASSRSRSVRRSGQVTRSIPPTRGSQFVRPLTSTTTPTSSRPVTRSIPPTRGSQFVRPLTSTTTPTSSRPVTRGSQTAKSVTKSKTARNKNLSGKRINWAKEKETLEQILENYHLHPEIENHIPKEKLETLVKEINTKKL